MRRRAFLATGAVAAGGLSGCIGLPPLGPTGPKTVTLADRSDSETERAIQSALSSRSILTVELLDVPREGPRNPLNDYRVANYRQPAGEDEEGRSHTTAGTYRWRTMARSRRGCTTSPCSTRSIDRGWNVTSGTWTTPGSA